MRAEFGVIGMAVMGQNLALNVESRGYTVAVYNRTKARTDEFMQEKGKEPRPGEKDRPHILPGGVRGFA